MEDGHAPVLLVIDMKLGHCLLLDATGGIHMENKEMMGFNFLVAMAVSFGGEVDVDLLLRSEIFPLNDGT